MASPRRELLKKLAKNPRVWFGVTITVTFTALALLAPWIAPTDPDAMDISKRLLPPGPEAWLGTDVNGADILTALLYGGRTSLYIGFLTVALSVSLGMGIGLWAGYKRGFVDALLMRTVDLLMAFPGILLAMALAALMGPSVHNLILAIAATGWTSSARLIRGQTLSVREREFVVSSKAMGAGDTRIVLKHILPSVFSPLLVQATFSLSGVIIVEASLSFLGLGATDGPPSWGAMLNQGRAVLTEAPHLSIMPGATIAMIVLALNFLGDALRDILDPRAAK